jgi:hypothetical protein
MYVQGLSTGIIDSGDAERLGNVINRTVGGPDIDDDIYDDDDEDDEDEETGTGNDAFNFRVLFLLLLGDCPSVEQQPELIRLAFRLFILIFIVIVDIFVSLNL